MITLTLLKLAAVSVVVLSPNYLQRINAQGPSPSVTSSPSGQTAAQTMIAVTAEERAAANDAYQKKDWKASAAAYEKIARAEDKNPQALYRLGTSLLNLNEASDAEAPLERAMSISPNTVFALALARAYARTGKTEKLYGLFDRSMTLGGISASSITAEKDFDSVKGEPKFADYVKKLDGVANPCRSRPEYRQFDFWIGEWAPQNPQGLTVATSSIQLVLGDCVIFENWNPAVGAGKSFSLWDARDGKWHQTWVNAKGVITHYIGGLEDNGKMVLVAEGTNNGRPYLLKMTYSKLPDGNVRQHGEISVDAGKTWTTRYDLTYVKVK